MISDLVAFSYWELQIKPALAMHSKKYSKFKQYDDNLASLIESGILDEI